jgi:type I restriction enzyme S subunit
MGEWRRVSIGEICDDGHANLQTGPFGTQLHAHDYVENGIPIVPTEAIRNRQIDRSILPKITAEKAQELARHRLSSGDILFADNATCCLEFWLDGGQSSWRSQLR